MEKSREKDDRTPRAPHSPNWPAKLKAARKARDLTLEELAEKTGVSLGAVQRLEKGYVTEGPAAAIGKFLGVHPPYAVIEDASELRWLAALRIYRAEHPAEHDAALEKLEQRIQQHPPLADAFDVEAAPGPGIGPMKIRKQPPHDLAVAAERRAKYSTTATREKATEKKT